MHLGSPLPFSFAMKTRTPKKRYNSKACYTLITTLRGTTSTSTPRSIRRSNCASRKTSKCEFRNSIFVVGCPHFEIATVTEHCPGNAGERASAAGARASVLIDALYQWRPGAFDPMLPNRVLRTEIPRSP
jgi:hypothetical protein